MMGSSQEQMNPDAKAMQNKKQQPTMAQPPTAIKQQQPQPATAPTGYYIPSSAGSPLAAVVAAVAKTALAPVITTVTSTMSAPNATAAAITTLDQPSSSSTLLSASSPPPSSLSTSSASTLNSTSTPTSTLAFAPLSSTDPLRPAQANSTPTSTTTAVTTTATTTSSVTATPSIATTATGTAPSPPSGSHSSATASLDSTIRPTSMTVDQSQWDHSPGGFPETPGHTNYAYSNNYAAANQGYESTLISKQNSFDYPRDDGFSHISFLYANEKRFGDFHSLFRSVPDDEKLIEDYGCALQKEILVQGRLYISENHVCFHANIFGWVTTLVIAFSEITAIEKRLTAFVIPNAISIVTTTNTKGHFFASFLSRDAAHDLLMAAWRKSFPCAANASVANNSYSNGSSRQRSPTLLNDEEDNTDSMSFISGRGNPESRRNRHRRSFSNASQSATDVEGTGREDGPYWGGDDNGDAKAIGSGNNNLRRRGSKRAVLKKVLKDVIAPIIPDDSRNNGNGDGNIGSLSPNSITSTNGRKTGRGRSVSELPPRPTSFDGAGSRSSVDTARSSFEHEFLSPPLQRARAGTESLPHRRNATILPPSLGVPTVTTTATTAPSLSIQQQEHQQHQAQPASNKGIARPPTTCKCSKDNRHYANTYMSDTFPGTLESIWRLLFDSDFSKGFLTSDVMKGADVQEEPWQNAPDATTTRVTRYTRWLGMPIGPKTTKAIVTDVCEHKDFDDYVTVVTTTSTPDVPSGGSFTTKVRTCLTWAGPHQVLVVVTGAVEFTKSSWIKGQIEKGAAEGLTFHYKEVNSCMRKHIAAHPEDFASGSSVPAGQANQTAASTSAMSATPPVVPFVEMNGSIDKADQQARHDQKFKTQASAANGGAKHSTATSGSSLGLLSKLAKAFTWDSGASVSSSAVDSDEGSEGTVSHWVLLTILVVVMGANVYIWFQISSVSQQIAQIQKDILSIDQNHSYNHHYGHRRYSPQKHWGSQAYNEADLDELEREELFAREQEDAMWEWLTEREARHQRYRQATGVFSKSRVKVEMTKRQQQQQRAQESSGLTEKELRLQARIAELQEQLMAVDRQASDIKIDSQHVEQEVSSTSSLS